MNRRLFLHILTCIVFYSLLCLPAFANAKLQRLLQKQDRPTMAEFMACFDGNFPEEDPFGNDNSSYVNSIDANAASFIAGLDTFSRALHLHRLAETWSLLVTSWMLSIFHSANKGVYNASMVAAQQFEGVMLLA